MSLSSLCSESATVERRSTAAASSTNLGGHVDTWTADASAIPVSFPQPAGGRTATEAMRRNVTVSHTFFSTTDPAAATGDRLAFNGLKYLVQWVSNEGGRSQVYGIHTLLKS